MKQKKDMFPGQMSSEHTAKEIAKLRRKWEREGGPSFNELHAQNVASQARNAIANEQEAIARQRAAQELREMGEPEAALICEAGLQFPSD